jgi:hypothetical protein
MFSVLLSFIVTAQKKSDIETTIRNLEQLAVKGILQGDTTILKQVWAAECMVTTPRNTIAETRDAVFKNQKAGLIDYSSFERIIEKIEIQENVVVTMGYETFVAKHDLQEAKAGQSIKRRFTNVWMFLFSNSGYSQADSLYCNLSDRFEFDADTFTLTKNEKWAKRRTTKTFENQGLYHSTYLALNKDSSFKFLSVGEAIRKFISVGKWTMTETNLIRLDWDRNKTESICDSERLQERYHPYLFARPCCIQGWTFIISRKQLIPIKAKLIK